ncbi:hypothetical protein SCATT_p02750 (plasmid) [Streptantibioticus cattleyicolor NRRL 8057 = DSM 46488]|uniref:Uncharacterized protein n=1 Tax=Streptantibioticus cattleyicolor (strain ATCC 35852 / DSM 46488 / JCM 4925 / NBRC 14057 / NRRL 8057) TaxID=1003195 RepID=G8XF17_STREN|nr:hypothetical protein SCATT_p02750 [Streptantibioticus cattleyicolor NRRL 8057 = DSM 46488]
MHPAGERLHVQRLRVLPVDPVAHPAQLGEVTQPLRRNGVGRGRAVVSHAGILPSRLPARPPGPPAAGAAPASRLDPAL